MVKFSVYLNRHVFVMKYVLTLKCQTQMQQTTLQNVLNYFKEEVRLDISCELSVSLADSSLEILFSLKNNEKKIRMLPGNFAWCFNG